MFRETDNATTLQQSTPSSSLPSTAGLNLDPANLIPLCEQACQQKSTQGLHDLGKIIVAFHNPNLMTSERVVLALCMLDILDFDSALVSEVPEIVAQYKTNLNQYLCAVCNVKNITPDFRSELKQLLQVDPYYLPNRLPPFLSEPTAGESRKKFQHRRVAEHMIARQNHLVLKLVDQQLWSECIPKEALTFYRSGKAAAWEHKLKEMEQNSKKEKEQAEAEERALKVGQALYDQYEAIYTDVQEDESVVIALDKVKYLDERERDAFRIFPSNGVMTCVSYNQDHPSQSMSVQIATTIGKHSHGKDDTASFVMNARGELFMGTHVEDKFNHGSFMAGGDVIFAGEIKINAQGRITQITSYSGHYQPDMQAMYRCYLMLQKQGFDLSDCEFCLLNKEAGQKKFRIACFTDPTLMSKVQRNDPSVQPLLTKITNDSMDRLTEKQLLSHMSPQFRKLEKS